MAYIQDSICWGLPACLQSPGGWSTPQRSLGIVLLYMVPLLAPEGSFLCFSGTHMFPRHHSALRVPKTTITCSSETGVSYCFCSLFLQKTVGSTLASRFWPAIHRDLHKPQIVPTTNLCLGFTASVRCHNQSCELQNTWEHQEVGNMPLWRINSFYSGRFWMPRNKDTQDQYIWKSHFICYCAGLGLWVLPQLLSCRRVVGKDWRQLFRSSLNKDPAAIGG